jgi:hypothetical protein
MMRTIVETIESEYRRYEHLGEGAIRQLNDEEVSRAGPAGGNSVAVIVWHVAGNLQSRFTDFLTSDGEKPWRQRESEFAVREITRAQALAKWDDGWAVLRGTLAGLADADLSRPVRIRHQVLSVLEALHRSLAHTAYHVGQIVFLARALRGPTWQYLSIPPGQSESYNQNPARERPPGEDRGATGQKTYS